MAQQSKSSLSVPPSRVLLGAAIAAAGCAPAIGQSQTSDSMQIEEIVVTASKRQQTLQEVPIAVSVIGRQEIERLGMTEFADYLPSVPGVQFIDGGNPYQKAISIRGVTDGSGSYLVQTPVATYLDETPLTLSQGAFNLDYGMFGVERVTVIKGPHSTLYGAASLGGTIKIETVKPSLDEFVVSGRASVSSVDDGDTGYTVGGTISGPVVENRLGLELTAYAIEQPGYIDDPSRNKEDINGSETTGGRLAARFVPVDDLTVDATFYYQKLELDSISFWSPSIGDLQSRPLLFDQPSEDELKLGSLVIRYDFGGAELVSATAYYEREGFVNQDYSSSFFNLGIPGSVVTTSIESPAEVLSQELRLVSADGSRLSWLIGGFYSNEDYTEITAFDHSIVGDLFSGELNYEYETVAVFGEVGFDLTDQLTLTAGGRYTDYTVNTTIALTGVFAIPGPPVDREDSETDFSPRVALNYDYGNGSVYVQAAKGFRLGQVNVPIVSGPDDFVPDFFESDSLWNYEVGAKTFWFDRRVELNAALYYIDWEDLQSTLTASTGFTYIRNVGSAEITGLELELNALLSDRLVWTAGLSYIDAELAEDVPTVAPEGTALPGVPEFTFSTSLQQGFTLAGRDGFARVDYLHYGEYDNGFPSGIGGVAKNGDYDKLDLRAGMTFGSVEVSLFATNVLDERPILYRDSTVGIEQVTTIQPRTYGLALTFDF